jgi:hypothetical protein
LPDSLAAGAKGVRDVRLETLSALPTFLPRVTPGESRAQLAARAAAFARRYAS